MTKPNNPFVFPHPGNSNYRLEPRLGMTMRDHIAIEVLASGMGQATDLGKLSSEQRMEVFELAAAICYEAADALLAVRQREAA